MNNIINISSNAVRTQAIMDVRRSSEQILQSTARLASGSRLANSSEDPGALAVALKLKFSGRSSEVVQGNLSNALSFLQAQGDGLSEIWTALNRIHGLATQMQDVTKGAEDTETYMREVDALREQIVGTQEASFNNQKLFVKFLGDSVDALSLQLGDTGQSLNLSRPDFSAGDASNAWIFLLGTGAPYTGVGTDSAEGLRALVETGGFGLLEQAVAGMVAENGAQRERVELSLAHTRQRRSAVESAAGKITDTEVAREVARLGASNIRLDASNAVLTQANVFGEVAVRLLGAIGL